LNNLNYLSCILWIVNLFHNFIFRKI
jgi:hypothetical protein